MASFDYTIEQMQQCKSLIQGIWIIGKHTVTLATNEREYPFCDCKAYTFGKRTIYFGGRFYPPQCKHIIEAEKKRCGWHEQWGEEAQTEEERKGMICPKCKGETMWVSVAV